MACHKRVMREGQRGNGVKKKWGAGMNKTAKYRRYLIIYACFILLPLIGVFAVFKKAPSEIKKDCENYLEGGDTGALLKGSTVEQTFTPDKDGLCHVDVVFETDDRIISTQVFLEIRSDNDEIIFSRCVPVSEIEDYKYFGLEFEPIASSKNRLFRIRISSDAEDAENAITVCTSLENRYDRGALYINGVETDADIALRTFYDSKYEAERLKRFVCLLTVLAALSAALYPAVFRRFRKPAVKLAFWTVSSSAMAFCILAVYNRVWGYCSVIDLFSAKALLKFFLFLPPVMTAVSLAFYNAGRLLDRAYAKKRLGEMIRDLAPAFTTASVFLFMMLLYEPILIYSTNKYDFQFRLTTILPPLFLFFCVGIVLGFSAAFVLYLVNRLFSKTPKVYQCTVIGLFVVFFATYVQGNWMVKDLPVLRGNAIKWDAYLKNDIITVILWVILTAAAIGFTVKFTAEKVMKITAWFSAAVFAMLFAGMISQMISNDIFRGNDRRFMATKANFSVISDEENFIILMVDSVDAVMFDGLLSANDEDKKIFDDFTFYTDAMSAYSWTELAVPNMLSGKINKNEMNLEDFSNDAYNNSGLFRELTERGYDMCLYEHNAIIWSGEKTYEILNEVSSNPEKVDYKEYFGQQMKYVLFKYLPYACKRYAGIETVSYDNVFSYDMELLYADTNPTVWEKIKEESILTRQKKPMFHFVQMEGAHVPFDQDRDMNIIQDGAYRQKGEAVITLLNAYLQRLKDNGVYDNSVIIILADHGYSRYTDDIRENLFWLPRVNPILLIKGRDEKHELFKSDVPISYITDLQGAYVDLLEGKKSEELFTDIPKQRTRTFYLYTFEGDDYVFEYETDGKAWEWEKFKPTGNVYNLPQN